MSTITRRRPPTFYENVQAHQLSPLVEFDSVFEVLGGGLVRERHDLHAPSLLDGELDSSDWSLPFTGYTGQYGYSGPIMHNSELLAGRLAADVLERPGIYALVVSEYSPEDDDPDGELYAEGWAIASLDV